MWVLRASLFVLSAVYCVDVKTNVFNMKATFPNKTSPRLHLTDPFPALKEFTLCTWIRPEVNGGQDPGVIFSYETLNKSSKLLLRSNRIDSDLIVRLQINTNWFEFNCTGVSRVMSNWIHICTTWFSPDGSFKAFLGGEPCPVRQKSTIYESRLDGGGIAIVGQEKAAIEGYVRRIQGWMGDISELHMWDEVLSADAIWGIGKCTAVLANGNIINWLKTPMTAYDGVILSETQLCKT